MSDRQLHHGSIGALLEQIDSRAQVFFFQTTQGNQPREPQDFAPLYYGFMNEFHSLLFT